MLNDIGYAFRLMRRSPGFTAMALLLLGIATGTATTIFGVADALLLRKLSVAHPEELVSSHGGSYILLQEFRRLNEVVADAAGICLLDRFNVTIGGSNASLDAGPVRVALVSGNYFSLLGIRVRLGRVLTPDDDRQPGADPVAVISDRYWRVRFASDEAVVGRTLALNGITYTVVGVMPSSFTGDTIARPVDIWMPTMMQSQVMTEMPGLLARTNGWLRIVARLQRGVALPQARAAMQTVYTRNQLAAAGAAASPQMIQSIERERFELVSMARGYSRDRESVVLTLQILAVVACLLLVIACANVANLMLARAESRQREIATRIAIGGGYGRIVRQLLTESLVLSFAGGSVGLLLAAWVTDALSASVFFGPTQMDPRAPSAWLTFDVRLGSMACLFGLLLCVVAGVVFGLAPAVRGARMSLSSVLTGFGRGSGTRESRVGDVLIVAQVAVSLILLIDATLFVRSVRNIKDADLGVDRSHLLLVWANPGQTTSVNALIETARTIRERLLAVPGVAAASMSNHGLLEGNEGGASSDLIGVDGRPAPPGLQVYRDAVAPGFFATAGTPMVSGREFTDHDAPDAPRVIVINQALAHFLFGDQDPVGRRVTLPTDRAPVEIVGVVHNVRHGTPRDARGVWYVPAAQYAGLMRTMCIVIRTTVAPAAVAATVRRELVAIDPTLPILHIDTLAEQLDEVLVHERIVAGFSSMFGGLAACVAALGLYAIVWYAFSRRTREIGIRIALGATAATIVNSAVRGVLARTAVGVMIAIPLAAALARFASSRLYGIGSADPLTMAAAAVAMAIVAVGAAFVPARAAARLNPVVALRVDA
jgi:predicted permease